MRDPRKTITITATVAILALGAPTLKAQQDNPGSTGVLNLVAYDVDSSNAANAFAVSELAAPATPSPAGPAASPAAPAATPAPVISVVQSQAQAATPSGMARFFASTQVSSSFDGYYSYNPNDPQPDVSALRAFDGPANQFSFNLGELAITRQPDAKSIPFAYNLTLGYGNAIDVMNGPNAGDVRFTHYIEQAYASYLAPLGKGLELDFGKFFTPVGAEVMEANSNWNYSRSLLFTYAEPLYHFGLRTKYTFNDKFTLTTILANGWNNVIDSNPGKTAGVSLGWTPNKKVSVTQTYLAGPEESYGGSHWRQLSDTVVAYSPTAKLSLMANYDYGRGDQMPTVGHPVFWTGIASYARYAFNNKYAVSERYEYYDDADGFTTGTAQHIHEFTGTFERIFAKHFITRLEFRRDASSAPVFNKGALPAATQNTVTGSVICVFDLHKVG